MKTFMASPSTIERKWYVVDATGYTLGRLASEIAKVLRGKNKPIYTPHIDTGDYVIVVNADQIQVSGKKMEQKIYYSHSDYVGGMKETTLKEMSELLGKETIDLYNTSETRSNQKSFGLNYQKTGKQLMTEDEIAVMDGGKCILQIRGARPFFSDKYDITKHKNYRLLADENEKNRYKVEKELNPQYTPKSEEEVEVIHVELSE